MKKLLVVVTLLFFVSHANTQNVGVGTSTPAEKLDVNGNINISGNIRVNNTAGQPNQVLMTNNAGNTAWADYCEFKNFHCFQAAGPAAWTVPAGVTKVMIEAWGCWRRRGRWWRRWLRGLCKINKHSGTRPDN